MNQDFSDRLLEPIRNLSNSSLVYWLAKKSEASFIVLHRPLAVGRLLEFFGEALRANTGL
jgi:hypothetical protein